MVEAMTKTGVTTGDSGTLRSNLRGFKSKVLLDNAHPGARGVRQAGSVVLRIDDLSISAAMDSGRELLPFVGGIRASGQGLWQPEICGTLKGMPSKASSLKGVKLRIL
ncbi:hypothetical protein GmRootV213_00200 [Variovorax sp. V213]